MSLSPHFSIHLYDRPIQASVVSVSDAACALWIGEPNSANVLTIFLPADRRADVQRIADALNEMGKPVEKAEAA